MRRLAVAFPLVPLLLAATGCGSAESKAPPTSSATAEQRSADDEACRRLLPDAAANALAGTKTELPVATQVGGLDGCRWDMKTGDWIQVVDVPAAQWAKQLPTAIDQAKASGQIKPEVLSRLESSIKPLRAGKALSGEQACALFRTWATQLQKAPKGADVVLSFVPAPPATPQATNAQRCVGGRYTSVLFVAAETLGTPKELQKIRAALASVPAGRV